MKIHKVTDREIEICGWAMENETEGCVKLAIQMQLALLMEIRNENKKPLLQKIKEKIFGLPKVKRQKVYTTPTGNKKDIIVGGHRPAESSYQPKPTDAKGEIKAPQGGTGESCGGRQCEECECADGTLNDIGESNFGDKKPVKSKIKVLREGSIVPVKPKKKKGRK